MSRSTRHNTISRLVGLFLDVHHERQQDLIPILGISGAQISKRMHSKSPWTINDLEALADHWGVPFAVFAKTEEEVDELEAELRNLRIEADKTAFDLLKSRITWFTTPVPA